MSDKIKLDAEARTIVGKKVSELRKLEKLPAVVYIKGKDSVNITIDLKEFNSAVKKAGYTQPVELEIKEGEHFLTLVREIDYEPVKQKKMHVTFQAIDKNKKVQASVPLHIDEEHAPAKRLGLDVLNIEDHIEVECLPHDMPKFLELDPSVLNSIGDKIHASDVKLPDGVVLISEPEMLLIVVEEPRVTSDADLEDSTAPEATDVPAENGAPKVDTATETK
jgi:large subunit ribosomal protein L25